MPTMTLRAHRVACALAALGLLLGAGHVAAGEARDCDAATTRSAPTRSDAPTLPKPAHFGAEVRAENKDEAGARWRTAFESALTEGVPASAAVVDRHGRLSTATQGVPSDAPFQAASLTKIFTATMVLQLADEGRLSLDATVEEWFPAVPMAGRITIDQLLRHTSGLSVPEGDALDASYRNPRDEIARLQGSAPMFCPDSGWSYSNVGYLMLGEIIEAVDGRTLAAALKARVSDPLDLHHTYFPEPGVHDDRVIVGRRAGEPLAAVDYASAGAAGALVSTPSDLVRFWRGVMAARVLTPGSRAKLIDTLHPVDGGKTLAYGRGVMAYFLPANAQGDYPVLLGHSGRIDGFNAMLGYSVRDDVFFAVMSGDNAWSSENAAGEILQALR